MSGYISLNYTGTPEIDAICEALEGAGNTYHHTESWGDASDWGDDKRSELEKIQEAINKAAARLATLEAEIRRAIATLMVDAIEYVPAISDALDILERSLSEPPRGETK